MRAGEEALLRLVSTCAIRRAAHAVVLCVVGRGVRSSFRVRPRRSAAGVSELGPHERFAMKIALPTLIAVLASRVPRPRPGRDDGGHTIVPPQEIKWGPAPAVLPPGAEAAILFGDPSKEGLFALRLKLPAGYSVPPHTHPVDEVVTVVLGRSVWEWETADQSKAQPLPAAVSSPFLQARRTMSSSTKRRSYKSAPSVHGDSRM